jgi:superfamily II DNA or RNA helicase
MDRLVCGDVGFGKTEVALRAAFVAAINGKQVAVVVPTTLLARQHYRNFCQRFQGLPIKIAQMSRMVTSADMKIAREAGETVAKEVVDEMFVTLAQKLDLLLRLKLEVELGQRVIGKNAAEANVEGALILDEIREVINSNIATYQGEMVSRSANIEEV